MGLDLRGNLKGKKNYPQTNIAACKIVGDNCCSCCPSGDILNFV